MVREIDDNTYIPFYFDIHTSKTQFIGETSTTTALATKAAILIEFDFQGLFGLDQQLCQLRNHIAKINRLIEGNTEGKTKAKKYRRHGPLLICGPSGTVLSSFTKWRMD